MTKVNRALPWVALLLLIASVSSVSTQAGKVSGSFVLNGKKVALQAITAVSYDTASLGRMVSVLVSDKAPDPKKFREYSQIGPGERYVPGLVTGAWVAMHADDKAFSGLHFTVDSKRQVKLTEVLVGGRNNNFGILDEYLVIELTSVSPRLAGRLRTKDATADLGSQKVALDLTFDTPVTELGK